MGQKGGQHQGASPPSSCDVDACRCRLADVYLLGCQEGERRVGCSCHGCVARFQGRKGRGRSLARGATRGIAPVGRRRSCRCSRARRQRRCALHVLFPGHFAPGHPLSLVSGSSRGERSRAQDSSVARLPGEKHPGPLHLAGRFSSQSPRGCPIAEGYVRVGGSEEQLDMSDSRPPGTGGRPIGSLWA